jgi:hypothetical protein
LSNEKIRNLLGPWFTEAFCADSSNLQNFELISIIARIFAQEINFCPKPKLNSLMFPQEDFELWTFPAISGE